MTGRWIRAVPIFLSLALVSASARAQDVVEVESTGCAPDLDAAVESALGVELSAASVTLLAALRDGSLRCELQCDDAGVIAGVVSADGQRLVQRVEGGDPSLPRRLALVLSELLDASLVVEAAPAATSPETTEAVVPPPVTSSDAVALRLRAAGGAWLGGEPLLTLGAIEVGAEIDAGPNFAAVFDVGAALGGLDADVGRVDVRLLSAGVSIRFGGAVDAFWLGGGPAARGGAASWTGRPSDGGLRGRDFTSGWLGVGAVGAAFVRLGPSPVRVGIEVEGGAIAVHSEVLALGEPIARVGNGWIEIRIALDVALVESP